MGEEYEGGLIVPMDETLKPNTPVLKPRSSVAWQQERWLRTIRSNVSEPLNWIVWVGILLYILISIFSLFLAFYFSLTDYNLLYTTSEYVGLNNYVELAQDSDFLRSLKITLIISLSVTLSVNTLGLLIALMLNHRGRYFSFLRTMFFIPQVLSAVIVSFIWKIILTDRGLLNSILGQIGLIESPIHWLGLPNLALFSVGMVVTWQLLGFCAVIYLASLQGVPSDLLEAASIDGASPWQRFWHVTWPLIAPGVTINLVLILIIVFKLYDQVAVLTGGGPAGRTETLSYYIIRIGFVMNRTGYASALAVVLFLIITVLSSLSVTYLKRREVEVS
jgi:multiple sugar transport system permease protein